MENNKEYDLLDLIKWCWSVFVQYVWRPLVFLCRFGLKKWYFLLAAALFGVLLSVLLPLCIIKKYSGTMLVQAHVGQSSDYVNLLSVLNEEDRLLMSQKLNMPVSDLTSLVRILPHYVYPMDSLGVGYDINFDDEDGFSKYPVLRSVFCVEVEAYDSLFLRNISQSIINYLQNDDYVKTSNEIRLHNVHNNIAVLKNELVMLDSLRKIEYLEKSRKSIAVPNSQTGVMMQQQTRLMHDDIIGLSARLSSFENILVYNKEPLKVITPMSIGALPLNHWTKKFIKYALICVALTYVGLLVWNFRKEIIHFANE